MELSVNAEQGLVQAPHPTDFPDFDDAGLAARLRISISTLRAWRCRSPHRLPPGVQVGRSWLYDKNVVEGWLSARRVTVPSISTATNFSQPVLIGVKRRGKPSREETEAAKKMGLTVPAWRARQAGGGV